MSVWQASDSRLDRNGRVRVARMGGPVLPGRHVRRTDAPALRDAIPRASRSTPPSTARRPARQLGKLADRTAPGFQFSLKVPRTVSHERASTRRSRSGQAADELAARHRLTGFVLQFPETFRDTAKHRDWISRSPTGCTGTRPGSSSATPPGTARDWATGSASTGWTWRPWTSRPCPSCSPAANRPRGHSRLRPAPLPARRELVRRWQGPVRLRLLGRRAARMGRSAQGGRPRG